MDWTCKKYPEHNEKVITSRETAELPMKNLVDNFPCDHEKSFEFVCKRETHINFADACETHCKFAYNCEKSCENVLTEKELQASKDVQNERKMQSNSNASTIFMLAVFAVLMLLSVVFPFLGRAVATASAAEVLNEFCADSVNSGVEQNSDINIENKTDINIENKTDVNVENKTISDVKTSGKKIYSSYVVIEAETCRVLRGSFVHTKLPMASTTKVVTALTVLQNADVNEVVKIPKEAVGVEGSSIYLKEGEQLSVLELLYGLMLRSGNDSAVALAIHVSGSVEKFANLMNETARRLGATNSNFTNPHGLHDDNHYTTAYDLAIITAEAMKNEVFKTISSAKSAVLEGGSEKRYIQNKNKMLWQYEGANGVKTGFTKAAGRCLVSAAERGGMQLVAVVLNCPNMWDDSKALLSYGFDNFEMYPLLNPENLYFADVTNGKYEKCELYLKSMKAVSSLELYDGAKIAFRNGIPYYPLTDEEIKSLYVEVKIDTLTAPFDEDTEAGEIVVNVLNRLLYSEKLYTINGVKKKGIFS